MNNKIFSLFILFSLFSFTADALENAVIYTKKGERIECQAERVVELMQYSIKFKRTPTARYESIIKGDIDTVKYFYKNGDIQVLCSFPLVAYDDAAKGKYTDKEISDARFGYWLPLVKKGPLTWFYNDSNHQKHGPVMFVVKKSETDYGVYFWEKKRSKISKKGKIGLANYLSDYPELAKSILERELMTEDIEGIVDEYNQWKVLQK